MSSDSEDQCLPTSPIKCTDEPQKHSKIKYSRDFLLSFSELDTCKRLPSGFEKSILSEFQEASESIPEWRRIPGSLSFHGSAPTTRMESSGNYSRGSHARNVWQGSGSGHGRWESHSGSNDRDGDQQSDRDSVAAQDSGRRYGHQSRNSWQSPEHDGLLGSGSFPRPSGSTGGPLSPKVQGSGSVQYHLNRSTEPYHPPRPYKAVNYSRRDTTDSFNDETFGSMECSGQDRIEEERMRRESFELMRKEQHKMLQEKQKPIPNKQIDPLELDIAANLEKSEAGESLQSENNRRIEDFATLDSQDHRFFPTQAPAHRPLVPPGFASTKLEKNLGTKSSDGKNEFVENNVYMDGVAVEDGSDVLPFVEPIETVNNPVLNESNKGSADDTIRVEEEHSTSILEKLFGNALAVDDDNDGVPSFIEHHQSVVADNDTWHPMNSHSSKFANWFLEQDSDLSSSKAKEDILALFVNNEKGASQVSKEKAVEIISLENHQISQEKLVTSTATSATIGINEPFHDSEKPGVRSEVLTCEDLEQSILAEVETTSSLQGSWNALDLKVDQQNVDVDDHASQHLLSLLQKGSGMKDHLPFFANQETGSSGGLGIGERGSISGVPSNASGMEAETSQSPEQILTLETLFGTAFMQELHSVEAPLSTKRSLAGAVRTDALEPLGLPFPVANDGLAHLGASDSVSGRTIHEGNNVASSGHIWEDNPEKIHGRWLGFDDPEVKSSNLPAVRGFQQNRPDRTLDIQLPEEETLITVGEPVNMETSRFIMPVGHVQKPEDFEIADKIAALHAIFKEDRSVMPCFNLQPPPPRPHYNNPGEPEILHQNLIGRLASQQLAHFPMDHSRPMYPQHLEQYQPHRNQQLKFIGQENLHHDPHHPYPANIFRHPFHNPGGPRFDHPSLQQTHISSANFMPPHLLQAMPRGVPLPQPINHAGGYMPEMLNPVQGFPFNHPPRNYGGPGMAMPGPGGGGGGGGGGNRPDALERLMIEMELRANSNKKAPAPGYNPGINGSDLDIAGFRYR